MGSSQSALSKAILLAVGGDDKLCAFPGDPLYKERDVKLYNHAVPVKPSAVTYPKTREQVAAIVKCATEAGLKVQARSGGHSYANYCIGGIDGAIVIDLKHFQHFSMNEKTFVATVGAGTLLGELTKRLHDAGNRAVAHGTCPQVGIGGHATIGGLGPTSRMWGALLDHILEAEVVLADSSIVRCSASSNSDVFWAIRGAGASFGIVTEFVLRTEPEPGEAVQFSFSFTGGKYASMGATFKAWQKFVADPNLTRRFASEVIFTAVGMIISGTFFGSQAEYDALNLLSTFPGSQDHKTVLFKDWLGMVGHWGENVALLLGGGIAAPMYTKSLTFNGYNLIPDVVIDKFLLYMDDVRKGTVIWFVIFDLQGGAVNDITQDATAYAHRDALFYMQSYAVGMPKLLDETKAFLKGLNTLIQSAMPLSDFGAYPGYVDPELEKGQREYWRGNLERLEEIKAVVDPGDVFSNPQSVRPARVVGEKEEVEKSVIVAKEKKEKKFLCF